MLLIVCAVLLSLNLSSSTPFPLYMVCMVMDLPHLPIRHPLETLPYDISLATHG